MTLSTCRLPARWRRPSIRILGALAAFSAIVGCHSSLTDTDDPGAEPRATTATPGLDSLVVDSLTLPADGASMTLVRARLSSSATAGSEVTFSTSAGDLGSVESATSSRQLTTAVDTALAATVVLRAPKDPGLAVVSARFGQQIVTATVTFTSALAEAITLEPARFAVPATLDSTTNITATLSRSVGVPSPGARVVFRATRLNGDSVGRFGAALPTDAARTTTVRFTAAPADTGTVIISATTAGKSGTSVVGTTVITVKP